MKEINTYIIEKLRINKKYEPIDYDKINSILFDIESCLNSNFLFENDDYIITKYGSNEIHLEFKKHISFSLISNIIDKIENDILKDESFLMNDKQNQRAVYIHI